MLLDWNGREKALIHLIDVIEKKIGINNVEQMDIQNKTYWPVGFIAETKQRQKLVGLQLEMFERLSNVPDENSEMQVKDNTNGKVQYTFEQRRLMDLNKRYIEILTKGMSNEQRTKFISE